MTAFTKLTAQSLKFFSQTHVFDTFAILQLWLNSAVSRDLSDFFITDFS